MWVVTTYLLQLLLESFEAGGGSASFFYPLSNVWIGLIQAPCPSLDQNTNLGSIVEANYDGYARQKVQWYPPFIQAAGPFALEGLSLQFQPTDATVPNNIGGVFMATALTGGTYLAGMNLGVNVVPLANFLQAMMVDPIFSLPFTQVYGGPDITN